MAIVVHVLGLWCRRFIEWCRTRIMVRQAEREMDIEDRGQVPREYFAYRVKHQVCQQPLRIARDPRGVVFRYCPLCRGGVDNHLTFRPATVVGIESHSNFKPTKTAPGRTPAA